jgi:serine/threonine protein kinase
MRNIELGDVWELISTDKLRTMDIKGIVKDVMQAVNVLHSRGVAHRDIKDANVLVENDAKNPGKHRAFLCDMSLATCSPHMIGDPFLPYTGKYRAPEVVKYGTKLDFGVDWFKADVYALGALLARMVCASMWGSKVGGHPPSRKLVATAMPDFVGKNVILSMMDEDPAKRPNIIEAMRAFSLETVPVTAWKPREPVPHSSDSEIATFSKNKKLPSWIASVANEIYETLPPEESGVDARWRAMHCVAMAAKIGVMARERDVLGKNFAKRHGNDLKMITSIVIRNRKSRDALHNLLRSDLPQS